MTTYYPPIEDITEFNSALFTNEPDAISQGQASLLYLSKVNSDTSTAPQTNFTGNVSFTVLPQSSAVPLNLPDLVNKNYTDTTFQTIANMVNYLTTATASATYLTIANASSTYQTIAGMSAYLTTALASTTYLTIANASSTYQTIAGMSAYLTTATASATYQTIANMVNYVDIASPQTITGLKLFTNNLEVYNATANLTLRVSSGTTQQSIVKQNGSQLQIINNSTTSPAIVFTVSTATKLTVSPTQCLLDATCFLTTNDIKSRAPTSAHTLLSDITSGTLTISSTTASNTINGATTFSQTATFSVIPNCSVSATSASQLVNYTTLTTQGYTTLPIIQANANAWTNTNTFNSFLPTSTITASSANQLVNYTTLTTQGYTTLALVQANNNVWTGTNSFNTNIPTTTITASSANQLVNYTTLTTQGYTTLALVQANANAWTNTNTFNSFLPTSTITASSANQLVNYTTLTTQGYTTLALVQANNNVWTGTNQFNQPIKIQYAALQYTELKQNAQVLYLTNISAGGQFRFYCRDNAGITDIDVAIIQTSGITLGINTGTNSIYGNTTFNHNVSISGTAGITGLLTATGGVKTGDITPIVSSAQQNIYTALGIGGTIFFGTALRTMNIYGAVNMVNSCQFSNALQTNDITHITGQSNTAKNIYTGLTTGGSITIGAITANTTTNIRGGAINIGGSGNILTIDSTTTFNNFLKSDDITAITTTSTHSIYTTLTSGGTINMGNTTTGTITNIKGGAINIGGSANNLAIDSPTTFNNFLKSDDITAITTTSTHSIYTTLTSGGTINMGNTTTGTITNINGGTLNLASINSTTNFNSTTNNFTSTGALSIDSSVAPSSFSFFSSLINTTINFFNGLTSGTINLGSSSTLNTMFNLNARVKLRTYKLVDELQTLTATSHTLVFPLEQTTVFTNTANISVDLPEITNDSQLGLRFTFVSLGSITTTVTFNRQGTNLIIPVGQMTQFTSVAIINNTKTICNLVIVKLSGIYIWTEYTF